MVTVQVIMGFPKMVVSYGTVFKCCRICSLIFILIISILAYQIFSNYDEFNQETFVFPKDSDETYDSERYSTTLKNVTHPIILWWTHFTGEPGATRTCGDKKCFFTNNRNYKDLPNRKVFMFYGTDYNPSDLPLPRLPDHEWGLLHEESPKNNYLFSHNETMILFNHTSTFRRHSNYPITTQHLSSLHDLTTTEYLVPVERKNQLLREENLALVTYVQSDCGTPSDRDHLVQMLQQHIDVDCYGSCLHNKDLPKHLQDPLKGMDHKDFYHQMAKYKFILALENGVCEDYITEKFWRPFIVGSVPIVFGSPKAKEFIPANNSAIFVDDFSNIKELVDLILKINRSDLLYNEYLSYKKSGIQNSLLIKEMTEREWAVNDFDSISFIEAFECAVCRRVHENLERESKGLPMIKREASWNHYGCPRPKSFIDSPPGSLLQVDNLWWIDEYERTMYTSKAVLQLLQQGQVFGSSEINQRAAEIKRGQK